MHNYTWRKKGCDGLSECRRLRAHLQYQINTVFTGSLVLFGTLRIVSAGIGDSEQKGIYL